MGEQFHELKTTDVYWDAVNCGEKTFEVRRNDRGFQKGDLLHLIRVRGTGAFAYVENCKVIRKRISYLLQGGQFGIEPGFCVLGLVDVENLTADKGVGS